MLVAGDKVVTEELVANQGGRRGSRWQVKNGSLGR